MEGLTPQHHGFLNGLVNKIMEERRQTYERFRQMYKENPLALEQIDIYDGESPYKQHFKLYRDALTYRDQFAIQREEAWLAWHYPLTSKRYEYNND